MIAKADMMEVLLVACPSFEPTTNAYGKLSGARAGQ